MTTIEVMARANLTIQSQTITVGQVATFELTDEVQGCLNMTLLVARNPDTGLFPDLGPLGPPRPSGCGCG